jgi:hypothetical protein
MMGSVDNRHAKVCGAYTDQGPHGPISLPNVTHWSGYARQSQTEITRPASQHSHTFNT